MEDIRIDYEFQNQIPPLSEEEFKLLEENILEAGKVYEPIVTWNGIIVDGHNRYMIIQKHPEITYETRAIDFSDKAEAFEWMYKHQLGRRNLTDEQRTILLGKLYESRKNNHGGDRKSSLQNDNLNQGRVAEQIASEQGTSTASVLRAYKYNQGMKSIREQDPGFADDIIAGKEKVSKNDVIAVSKAKKEDRPALVADLKNGKSITGKTKEEKEADKRPKEKISKNAYELEHGSSYEATVEDLIQLFQLTADETVLSLTSVIRSSRSIVNSNKEKAVESLKEIFAEAIDKVSKKILAEGGKPE